MARRIAARTTSSGTWSSKGADLTAQDNEHRSALDWAKGVFLATHPPEPKPASMALITELLKAQGKEVR